MSQILDLGKIRFQFKGEWSAGTEYQFNDVVSYKGIAYVYISTAKTTGTVTSNSIYWGKMTSGSEFAGTWSNATTYGLGSIVKYGANLYIYTATAASSGYLPTNTTYWTLYVPGWNYVGVWSNATAYKIGEVVSYGGNTYIAVQDSTAQNPDNNVSYWTLAIQGFQYEGTYNSATAYQKNDLVSYGGNTYIAITNTTGNLPTNTTYWNVFATGFKFESAWTSATAYQPGDVVTHGNQVYIAVTESTNQNPDNNPTYWSSFVPGIQWEGYYSAGTTYQKRDIVSYGGNTYIAKDSTTGNLPTNTTYWEVFVNGFKFEGTWSSATAYQPGDVITYGNIVYIAVIESTNQNPDNNPTYWSTFTPGIQYEGVYSNATSYQKSDLVTYGGNTYIAKTNTTGNLPTNTTYWDLFASGFKFEGAWDNATAYQPGDVIAHGGKVYIAVIESTGITPPNLTYWSAFADGLQYEGTFSLATSYQKNDIVVYGGTNYIAKQDTSGNLPTNSTYWEIFVQGLSVKGTYSALTSYVPDDLVNYGGNIYRAIANTNNNLPTNTTYWTLLLEGFKYIGNWQSAVAYKINELVTYGGSLYRAIVDNTNVNPKQSATWTKLTYGFKNKGIWATSTSYELDDVVTYGGNTFIVVDPHVSSAFETDLAAGSLQKLSSGIRWRGSWTSGVLYVKDDIVKDSLGSAYIATSEHTAGASFTSDLNAGKWTLFVIGGSDILPAIYTADTGQSLTVQANGINIAWLGATESANVYWVAPHGTDSATSGKNLATPFASIKYATQQCAPGATIFVKTGTYYEQLPITVPNNVAIVGDNQRTVIVAPKAGLSDDGVTPNNQSTMFLMSDGSILNKMTFKDMTGWVPGSTASDVTTSTIKGVVVRLNPSSPIILKSPYVLECAAICSGAIGALVDGSTHATGAKTMIFHGYTVISDNGIGYWVKDGGKAEIVSCFTYYCYFGYTSSGGGFIRALNGNNSYGTWGATSRGYDVSETPLTGTLLGQQLNFVYGGGTITAGNTITSATGSAIVTNVQYSSDKVYVRNITGTFSQGQTLTISGTTVGTVKAGALENQKGFVLVLNGLSSIPKTGSSISLAGDTYSYVIQSVSGTYVNTSSEIVLVLAQEKPTGSASGTAATIRTKYSQIRLTGHDFLSIGTGGTATTNYPGTPTQPSAQGNETDEVFPGRVFYVSTDQDGNFRVGEYFRIDQATGRATLNASAFDLAGLTSLRLGSIGAQLGETINEFSSDATLSGNSNLAVPTEYAVKTYVDSGTTTLTNKTINLTSNTLSGTRAQFNAALSDDDFATLSGTETLSNKTLVTPNLGTPSAINLANATNLPVASITASTTSALGVGSIELGHASDTTITRVSAGTIAVEGVNIVTTSSTNTLTNKTLTSPVISTIVNTGTLTLPTTTDTLVGRATTDTLTNKTLASPVITGTPTGITATHVGLGNVTNESKATMFSSPTFTGTVTGVTATHVGLGNVTNESKATMFSSPAFTGTPTTTTAGAGTNNTQIASTAYVVTEITNRSASASDFPYVVASNPTTFYYTTGAYISRQLVANASGAAITPTLVSGTLPTGTSLSGGYLQGTISGQGSFNFTVRFQSNYSITSYEFIANSAPVGQAIFTTAGVYSWTAPIGVTSVSVVAVGAGGIAGRVWASMGGGGGGGLGYRNNISVTPGTAYTVCVGCTVGNCPCPDYSTNPSCSGSSWFKDCSTVVGGGAGHGPFNGGLCCMLAGGGYVGDGGGYGGTSSNSWPCSVGAGAGGYGGCGGSSCFGDVNTYGNGMCGSGASGGCMYSSTYGLGGGGGTGVYGVGTPGCHNCDFNSQVAGCGGSYGGFFPNVTNAGSFNGMGGQGGSTCYGTGTPGHQGENPYAYCYQYVGSSYRGSGVFGGSACFYNVSNCYHMRSGGFPGGGGGAAGSTSNCSGYGGDGAVRIIWPGTSRSFPSTRTADE